MMTLLLILVAPPLVVALIMDWVRWRTAAAAPVRPVNLPSSPDVSLVGSHADGALLRAPVDLTDAMDEDSGVRPAPDRGALPSEEPRRLSVVQPRILERAAMKSYSPLGRKGRARTAE